MTTDPITREDLEMAAKAAGNPQGRRVAGGGLHTANELYWNPAEDDGDCARMEDVVGINIERGRDHLVASTTMIGKNFQTEVRKWAIGDYTDHANDKSRARRYASVKLAAAVGRAM